MGEAYRELVDVVPDNLLTDWESWVFEAMIVEKNDLSVFPANVRDLMFVMFVAGWRKRDENG